MRAILGFRLKSLNVRRYDYPQTRILSTLTVALTKDCAPPPIPCHHDSSLVNEAEDLNSANRILSGLTARPKSYPISSCDYQFRGTLLSSKSSPYPARLHSIQ